LLLALRDHGFTRIAGADPLLPRALQYNGGVRIHAGSFVDLPGLFDVVMFHHTLEHVPDPAATLDQVRDRLAPGGWAIVRMPVAGCHAWREYGVDWVQLDAPRHLHILTLRSM
jgi:SAM-dependent methyltransferase